MKSKTASVRNLSVSITKNLRSKRKKSGNFQIFYLNSANNECERIKKLTVFRHKQNISDKSKKEITIRSELFKSISEITVGNQKYDIMNGN